MGEALPSFEQIYQQHADMVYNLCLNYLHNTEEAEEAMQDTFLKVYAQMERFQGKSSIKTWVYRIAVNTCLDSIKAKNRAKRKFLIRRKSEDLPTVSDFNHPGVQLEDKEAVASLMQQINSLPDNQKTALLLKAMEGLSQKEIAEVMETSVKAVESLLSRAKSNLKKKINRSEGS